MLIWYFTDLFIKTFYI